jgi:hypothetical protein
MLSQCSTGEEKVSEEEEEVAEATDPGDQKDSETNRRKHYEAAGGSQTNSSLVQGDSSHPKHHPKSTRFNLPTFGDP